MRKFFLFLALCKGVFGITIPEELVYNVKILGISAGVQKLLTKEEKGKIIIISETKTNKFFSRFYKLDDYIETKLNKKSLLPLEIFEKIDEQGKKMEFLTKLNQEGLKAIVNEKEIRLSQETFNIPSLIYYLRNTPLVPSKKNISLITQGKVEEIGITIGDIESIYFYNKIIPTRKVSNKDVSVWFREDGIPIIIEVRLKCGLSLKGYLKQ